MKKLLGLVICLCAGIILSVGSTGCTPKKTETKEKKAAEKATEKGAEKVTEKDTKKIGVAAELTTVSLKPGENKEVKLTLTRGKEATKAATLSYTIEPKDKGVSVSGDDKVDAGRSEAKFEVKATGETPKGDYTVTVWVKSEGSPDADAKVTVKVGEKAAAVEKKAEEKKAEEKKAEEKKAEEKKAEEKKGEKKVEEKKAEEKKTGSANSNLRGRFALAAQDSFLSREELRLAR